MPPKGRKGLPQGRQRASKKNPSSSRSRSSTSSKSKTPKDTRSSSTKNAGFPWTQSKVAEFDFSDSRFVQICQWAKEGESVKRTVLDATQAEFKELESRAEACARGGEFEEAANLQDEADEKRSEWKRTKLIYDEGHSVFSIASMAISYHHSQKNYRMEGHWSAIKKACEVICVDDRPALPKNPPSRKRSAQPARTTVDLTTTTGSSSTQSSPAQPTSEKMAKDDSTQVKGADGSSKQVDDLLPTAKRHKNGLQKEAKSTRKGSNLGKVSKHQGDSKDGSNDKSLMRQSEFKKILNKKYGPRKNREKTVTREGPNKHGHSLYWKQEYDNGLGYMYCKVCSTVLTSKNVVQHIVMDAHCNKVARWTASEKKKEKFQQQLHHAARGEQIVGQSFSGAKKEFQVKMLDNIFRSNVTAHSFGGMAPFLDQHLEGELQIGQVIDLVERWKNVLYNIYVANHRTILSDENCFPEFGTVSDGTPSFANVENLRVVKVTKAGKIISVMVSFELYDESMTGEKHASHLIKGLCRKWHSPLANLENWKVATQDGCKVNGAAVRHIQECDDLVCKPHGNCCAPHTLGLSGKAFVTPNLKALRGRFNVVIRYRGKVVEYYKELFGQSPIKSGGIRWWIEFEQSAQWVEHGILNIVSDLCTWGVANNASAQSCQSLLTEFRDGPGAKEKLALALVENAAVVDGGRLFAVFTYITEGNDPLILIAYKVFDELDAFVGVGTTGYLHIDLPNVKKIAIKASEMMCESRDKIDKAVTSARAHVQVCQDDCLDKDQALQQLSVARARAGAGSRSSGRSTTARNDYSNISNDSAATDAEAKKKAEDELKAAKKTFATAKKALKESEKALADWDKEHKDHMSISGLIAHARRCIIPGFEKYKEQFINPRGRCTSLRLKAQCCKVFNPFELDVLPEPAICLLIDKFSEFKLSDGTRIFDDDFLRNMKGEVKKAKLHASRAFDWDSLPKSKQYKNRDHRRKLKKEAARVRMETREDGEYAPYEQSDVAGEYSKPKDSDKWQDDLGEYARRIWEWWLIRWLHVKDFTYFGLAIRKVVLWLLSSAVVERDFSQYVCIINACGNGLSFPVMQGRIFARCNKDVYDELAAKSLDSEEFNYSIMPKDDDDDDDDDGDAVVVDSDAEEVLEVDSDE